MFFWPTAMINFFALNFFASGFAFLILWDA